MLTFQAIVATAVLIAAAMGNRLPVGTALVAYLATLVLILVAVALPKQPVRASLAGAKLAGVALLSPHYPDILWLLPPLLAEMAELAASRSDRIAALSYVACGVASTVSAPLVPESSRAAYACLCALSLYASARERALLRASADGHERERALERELAASERHVASRARQEEALTLAARLEERERISLELHDGLGHAITGSVMQLEAAALLAEEDPRRAAESVAKASAALKDALASIRASVRGMRPETRAIGERRLRAAIEGFVSKHGIDATLSVDGDLSAMRAAAWRAIEDNLREAITNFLRHSDGSRLAARVSEYPGLFKAEISDDGSPKPRIAFGTGLDGMEARTRDAGGTLIVDSSRGFSIIMIFKREERADGR